MRQYIMSNPNFEMSPEDIQAVTRELRKAQTKYDAFSVLVTNDRVDKNHGMQWYASWLEEHTRKHAKPYPQALSNGVKREISRLDERIDNLNQ